MEFDLLVDRDSNTVRVKISGRCSFHDFGRFFLKLLEIEARPDLRILTDIRDAELSEGSFSGVSSVERNADRFVDAHMPVRQAIVVNTIINFGIARMYEALAEKDGYEVHIFDDPKAGRLSHIEK